jgi:hypothetical protein
MASRIFEGHQDGLERRVLHRNRIVEDDHHAVASVTFKRAAVFDDFLANGCVILAEHRYYVLRVRAFGEPGETPQVAEERGNLSTMALKLLLAPRGDDQISHLRRQKAPQSAHAFDFAYLVGDALFELLVEFDDFLSCFTEFVEQPRVLSGDNCLRSEIRYQRYLLLGECTNFLAGQYEHADQFTFLEHGVSWLMSICGLVVGFEAALA